MVTTGSMGTNSGETDPGGSSMGMSGSMTRELKAECRSIFPCMTWKGAGARTMVETSISQADWTKHKYEIASLKSERWQIATAETTQLFCNTPMTERGVQRGRVRPLPGRREAAP